MNVWKYFHFKRWGALTFKYNDSSLPKAICSISELLSLVGYLASTGKKNISKAQEELLMWRATLGHYNITNTQKIMGASGVDTEPILCPKEADIKSCTLPLCVACLKGKGKATSVPSTTESPNPSHFEVIKDGDLLPGATISAY